MSAGSEMGGPAGHAEAGGADDVLAAQEVEQAQPPYEILEVQEVRGVIPLLEPRDGMPPVIETAAALADVTSSTAASPVARLRSQQRWSG